VDVDDVKAVKMNKKAVDAADTQVVVEKAAGVKLE
jgi:hypothetical protein